MSLNNYRDEAENFLKEIGAKNGSITTKVNMLQEEFDILKEVIDDEEKLRHQVYDMLFILFEIAAEHKFDLDGEWDKGRKRKEEKYIFKREDKRISDR